MASVMATLYSLERSSNKSNWGEIRAGALPVHPFIEYLRKGDFSAVNDSDVKNSWTQLSKLEYLPYIDLDQDIFQYRKYRS